MPNDRNKKNSDLPRVEQRRATLFAKPTSSVRSQSLTGEVLPKLPVLNQKRSSVLTPMPPSIAENSEEKKSPKQRAHSLNTNIPDKLPPLALRRGSSKQADQPEVTLTEEEKKLCMENGVFPEDALQFKRTALLYKTNIEIRGGSSVLENKGEEEFSPKPIDIKEKSKKTSGFTRSLLSAREYKTLDTKAEVFKNTYHIPLGKILAAKNNQEENEYELIPGKSDFKTGRLVFKSTSTDPVPDPNIFYSIDLAHSNKKKKESAWAEGVTRPGWWSDDLNAAFPFDGDNGAIKYRYPAQYLDLKDPEKKFRPDLVWALRDRKGKILNIAGDIDLYAISISAADLEAVTRGKLQGKGYLIHERINTLEGTDSFRVMLRRRVELEEYRKGRNLTPIEREVFLDNLISQEKISKLGNLTARESEIISSANSGVAGDFKHKAIQHAPETGNKYCPQAVKKTLIFTAEGGLRFAPNEKELVDFRMEVIKEHFYHVSEACDMRLWGDYVAAQLLLKQPVSKTAIASFMSDVKRRFQDEFTLSDQMRQAYKELVDNPVNSAAPKPRPALVGDLEKLKALKQQYEERQKILSSPYHSVLDPKADIEREKKLDSSLLIRRKPGGG